MADSGVTEDPRDGAEVLEDWLDRRGYHQLEGERGVERLNDLAETLGYEESGFLFGSSLERLLADNSGACEALVEWVAQHVDQNASWRAALEGDGEDG